MKHDGTSDAMPETCLKQNPACSARVWRPVIVDWHEALGLSPRPSCGGEGLAVDRVADDSVGRVGGAGCGVGVAGGSR